MRNLETPRLLLRPLTIDDLDELHQLYGDKRVMEFVTGTPRTREESKQRLAAHLQQHEQFGFGLCAAITKSDNQMIGRCGLEPRTEAKGLVGELAWMFTPEMWAQGFGAEVGFELVAFGLKVLGLQRVYATADHRNLASIAIMKKLGMSQVSEDERGVEYEIT